MASTSVLTDLDSEDTGGFVGLMMDNVMIANALTDSN